MQKEIIKYALPRQKFNIKILDISPTNKLLGLHRHKETEIMKISRGSLKCFFTDREVTLKEGEILIINANVIHRLVALEESTISYIQVDISKYKNKISYTDSEFIEEYLTEINTVPFAVFSGSDELVGIFENIEREIKEKELGFENYIKGYIYNTVAFMYRNGLLSQGFAHSNRIGPILPVIKYIEENYKTKLYLDELALLIHSDRFNLCRKFKAVTAGTVFDYINFVRLKKAEELLLENNLTTTEIAFECGFTSIQYFNKVFKNSMGCSPTTFKKRSSSEL